jgi:hypothetical protein
VNFQAKHILPDGHIFVVQPVNGKTFNLQEMQRYVEGCIQIIRPPSMAGAVMVCNEEGKLAELSFNKIATSIWQEGCAPGSARNCDAIVGPVLLCHESQIE